MWIYICLITIIIAILTYGLVIHYFSQVVTRKLTNEEDMFREQIDRGLIDQRYYESLNKEEVYITSKDGLKLRGIYIESEKYSNKTMIFVHGITVGLIWSIKYIDMFIKRGWNVLIYDQRRHAMSEGKYSTYGYYEKEDLDLWVNWLIDKKGKEEIIGLHGESMGAATVLQYAAINKYVKFIIADCGFSDLRELLERKVRDDYHGLLYPIIKLSNLRAKRKAKFKFEWVSPIEVVKNAEIPMMFIHGDKDKFVPWDMSIKMYEAKIKGVKKLYIAEGAAHARSIEVDKDRYENEVMEFVNQVLENS